LANAPHVSLDNRGGFGRLFDRLPSACPGVGDRGMPLDGRIDTGDTLVEAAW
jgi:hypothetical protein